MISGTSIIGATRGIDSETTFEAVNPATGEKLKPLFQGASSGEVQKATELADAAFASYRNISGKERAVFLKSIGEKIMALGDELVERAVAETGLPAGRIEMERGRTVNQLNLFASLLEDGSWVNARIDTALPDRQPLPRPDLRAMLRPIGPVVVFCASNFPLAFSVAGGDTASALAAGCPVIVKAHHAHPGTAELVGSAIQAAVKVHGLHEGVFSLVFGSGKTVGTQLAKSPVVKAIGFTGSRSGGRALFDVAAARPEPIPVYAEMSSINPVFILPGALKEKGKAIAEGLAGSITLGVGQFCTNPGISILPKSQEAEEFVNQLKSSIEDFEGVMLHSGICDAYQAGVAKLIGTPNVSSVKSNQTDPGRGQAKAGSALFQTTAENFLSDPGLSDEVFGPASLLITSDSREQTLAIASNLEGHLTATIHGTDQDLAEWKDLIDILETKVGRLVFNGFPTGVEVCHSMVHGGPYPATTDSRTTSVGTLAIERFSRPVCYQNFPEDLLPDELKESNPLGIARLVNGVMQSS